jgi:peptide/nickel transport system permease protein
VAEIIAERLPATLELAAVSGAFALFFGIVLGIFTAIRRDGFAANAIMTISADRGVAADLPDRDPADLPVFAVELSWLPSFGRGEVVDLGWWSTGFLTQSGLVALILPSITLGLYQMTLIMRLVRSEMLEVMRQDYIRFARARGLKDRAIQLPPCAEEHAGAGDHGDGPATGLDHRLRDHHRDGVPVAGVGLLFINAIQFVDIPVMAAYLMLISVMFVAINLIVDLLYVAIDPRLRTDGKGA